MKKRIFVDCSYLYEHPHLNTGIQRVVRKVLDNLETLAKDKDLEIIPVVISHSNFFVIKKEHLYNQQNSSKSKLLNKESIKNYFKNILKAFRELIVALFPFKRVKNFVYAPKDTFGLSYIIYSIFKNRTQTKEPTNNNIEKEELKVTKDDILLLIDSSWYLNIWPTVSRLKKDGVKVVSVIYDLIPITNSEFCDDFLVEVFKSWFKESLNYIDKFIAISHTVENDLKAFLHKEFKIEIENSKFDHFLLGSDFSYNSNNNLTIRDSLKNIFSSKKNIYLIVCTIEPRKNHKYLLDVFDKLWEEKYDISLMIVGKVGWKVEDTINRINNHKKLHKNLFIFTDLNDKELNYCYKNSKMLLFPSIIEGFGLPIVESLSNNLPVLASNIPIHKEVGKDNIGYFDITNTDSLINLIKDIEQNGIPKNLIPPKDYKWLTWKNSTQQLLEKVLK